METDLAKCRAHQQVRLDLGYHFFDLVDVWRLSAGVLSAEIKKKKHTIGVASVDDGVFVLHIFDDAADQTLGAFGGVVDGDELVGTERGHG